MGEGLGLEHLLDRKAAEEERIVESRPELLIVRVDRMELSKNLLRGFWAFDELLELQPARRSRSAEIKATDGDCGPVIPSEETSTATEMEE